MGQLKAFTNGKITSNTMYIFVNVLSTIYNNKDYCNIMTYIITAIDFTSFTVTNFYWIKTIIIIT